MKQEEDKPSISMEQLEELLEFAPIAAGVSDLETEQIRFINDSFQRLFGYTLEDIPTLEAWYNKASSIDFRRNILEPWAQTVLENQSGQLQTHNLEAPFRCKNGTTRFIRLYLVYVEGKRLFYFSDITDYWVAEQRLKTRSNMLEMVAKSRALKDVLTVIVQQIQQESPGSICSVLLFDPERQRLVLGAAPDLPSFYNEAIHGLQIGPTAGSCGAAAYHNKRVIVEDIATHPNWRPYIELARQAKLHSCWSDPIRSVNGALLGTFAIYNSPSRTPSAKDLEQIQFASNLTSIAIENHYAHQELERRAYHDYLTGLANRRSFFEQSEAILKKSLLTKNNNALVMLDVDHFKHINDQYGHEQGDRVLQHLANTCLEHLPKDAIFSRIGGEEFAILLSNMAPNLVLDTMETLRQTLASHTLHSMDNQADIHFTVSIGIAFSQGNHTHTDELLREADKALYKAKRKGRNRICVFEQDKFS